MEANVSLAYIKVLNREGIFLIAIIDAAEPMRLAVVFIICKKGRALDK